LKILLLQKRGLGNQLFQYAAGLFFAKKYGAMLEVIPEPEHLASSFGHPRPFMLSNFCISTPVRRLTKWDRLMCSVAPIKKPIAVSARFASRSVYYQQDFLDDWTFLPELPIPRATQNLYLEGNFQAYQYAQNVEASVRAEFRLREPASGQNLDMLEKIRAAENSTSLHIRRGDYAIRGEGPQQLPLRYYSNAINTLHGRVGNPTFFVFSDDIAFARENLPKEQRMIFVDHNDESNGHEDLRLMSACRHNIIANSTFSWWGAWLNADSRRLVCVPESWNNINRNIRYPDLIPPDWLRIATDSAST
jgi:hypothetical protein